jgi:hypothetical protein
MFKAPSATTLANKLDRHQRRYEAGVAKHERAYQQGRAAVIASGQAAVERLAALRAEVEAEESEHRKVLEAATATT